MNEFDLIKKLARAVKTDSSVVRGIGDDAAVLKYQKDRYLLLTTDMIVEGTHFSFKSRGGSRTAPTPYQIGWKAMAVNLSDIAAMGGLPKWAVVSLGGPLQRRKMENRKWKIEKFVWEIYRGMDAAGKKFGAQIVGGDTDKAKQWTINIALLGEVEKKYLKLRSGARVGDRVFVTGSLGGSIQGKHLTFAPRLKEARYLVAHYPVTSMMDLSDGLASDLRRIMEQSKVGFLIDEKRVPLSRYAKDTRSAFCDGEDFELLFTVPKESSGKLEKNVKWARHIGEVTPASKGLRLRDRHGNIKNIQWRGFEHF